MPPTPMERTTNLELSMLHGASVSEIRICEEDVCIMFLTEIQIFEVEAQAHPLWLNLLFIGAILAVLAAAAVPVWFIVRRQRPSR